MLRYGTGHDRPVEQLFARLDFAVASDDELQHCRYYRVGGRLAVLLPGWVKGQRAREAMLAYQLCLWSLEAMGEDRMVAELSRLAIRALAHRADNMAAD